MAMANQLASQITFMLEAGDFDGADPLLSAFFARLEGDLAQMPDGRDRSAFLQDALGWMYRWLSLSRVMRSHLNEQIRLSVRETSYGAAFRHSSTVEFTA
ncbi:MAG: hypothetical protein JOY85_09990 [Acidobacteriaceae bacterium]|nr:hypothetical protein [Acidobacteriaceae bacterium]